MKLLAPCPLADHHLLDHFCCGVPSLDRWLQNKARPNESARASRTYVLLTNSQSTDKISKSDDQVIGYYALASGSIAANEAPRKIKRNMPDPIPVMILGRLAIDQKYQGQKLGQALLRDAILRILQAAEIAGIKAILVHAISEEAKKFYLDRSFIESPSDSMTLILPLEALTG